MSRVILAVLSALAVIGGAMMTLMIILYFGPTDEYVSALNEWGGWGIWAGAAALGVFVGGAVRAHLGVRILVGFVVGIVGFIASLVIGFLFSFIGDPGGERGTLADGIPGFLWLVAGGYLGWRALTGRSWPSDRNTWGNEVDF
jgi:hypothetical protein